MKLSRLSVNELRQFSRCFELVEFDPGLNLISGANETGKSTLVRALQAVFFERYSTRSVDDLRPWQDGEAAPEVQVDFEHGGQQYQLTKRFLKKSRCSLTRGAERFDGDNAEGVLQQLLGFSYPGKGASKEEYWGIPGLLWISQGTGQELARPIRHAQDFLRETLSQGLDELATSGGDVLIDEVAAERSELLTQTGKPTGELKKVTVEAESARQALQGIEQKLAQYQRSVDRLARVRKEYQAQEQERPWLEAERKQGEARQAAEAVNQQRQVLAAQESDLKRTRDERQLVQQQLGQWQREQEQLSARKARLSSLQQLLEEARQLRARLDGELRTGADTVKEAGVQLDQAQARRRRQELAASVEELRRSVTDQQSQLDRARQEHQKRLTLQRVQQGPRLEASAVEALAAAEERAREAALRREAIATRIRYQLEPGNAVQLGEQALEGAGEARLLEATRLSVPGVGELVIEPGGEDLGALNARAQDAVRQYQQQLQAQAVTSVAEARNRLADQREREQQLQWLDRTLSDLAPAGLEALEAELENRQVQLQRRQQEVAALGDTGATGISVAEAQQALEVARQQQQAIEARHQQSREAEIAAEAELRAVEQEYRELATRLQDPAREQQRQAAQDRLLQLSARIDQLEEEVAAVRGAIEAANPEILEDDIQRFGRAAESMRLAQRERQTEIARLEGELGAQGVSGLGEERAETQALAERLERHQQALALRARALDLLYQRLQQKRAEMVERLQAPLQKHVTHYLRLLFPDGELKISEAFQPGSLAREGEPEVDFSALSFGAREQIGVILRLAYADALKEAGRPTLVVLDDALVHSDPERREAMQRVLYSASRRHQILLFTCHPDNWADLGVPVRALEQLKTGLESGVPA